MIRDTGCEVRDTGTDVLPPWAVAIHRGLSTRRNPAFSEKPGFFSHRSPVEMLSALLRSPPPTRRTLLGSFFQPCFSANSSGVRVC